MDRAIFAPRKEYLMDMENKDRPVGSLKISQDVIASIAKFAALEIDGVEAVSTGNIGVKGLITKTNYVKAIRIELSEEVVNVEINVIVKHGSKIPDTATAIQQNVKDSIQSMTGLAVAKVDVIIAGVAINPDAAQTNAAQ